MNLSEKLFGGNEIKDYAILLIILLLICKLCFIIVTSIGMFWRSSNESCFVTKSICNNIVNRYVKLSLLNVAVDII